jgi:hypothetical protein
MNQSISLHKTLALCALVLGLMGTMATVAHAEEGASWSLLEKSLPGATDLLPELQIKEIENNTASLLFNSKGGTKVEHLCTEAELVGIKLLANGSTTNGKIRFKKCITKLNGVISKNCEPHSEGAPSGVVETTAASALIVLHLTTPEGSVVPILLMKPAEGETMATMIMGELCSIGELLTVKGELRLKDCANTLPTEQVAHLFEEGPLNKLTTLGQLTTMDGSMTIELSGVHKGLKWAGSSTAKKP